MITLGIDPDSKDLSFATWGDDGPINARVAHVVGKSTNYEMLEALATFSWSWCDYPDIVAIEGQQKDGRRARPQDLFKLAHVTGAAALLVRRAFREVPILIPTPRKWKGAVAKHAMQARMYRDLGWGYKIIGGGVSCYARPVNPPSNFNHITKGQWKHTGDALLLARWAYHNA